MSDAKRMTPDHWAVYAQMPDDMTVEIGPLRAHIAALEAEIASAGARGYARAREQALSFASGSDVPERVFDAIRAMQDGRDPRCKICGRAGGSLISDGDGMRCTGPHLNSPCDCTGAPHGWEPGCPPRS